MRHDPLHTLRTAIDAVREDTEGAAAPLPNPPKAWRTLPPSTAYPCTPADAKRVGVSVPNARGGSVGTITGCVTPAPKHPREGAFALRAPNGGQKVLRKSQVSRRFRAAEKGLVLEEGQHFEQIVPAAKRTLRDHERGQPHIPGPTGIEYPHLTGSNPCAPDHPMWRDVQDATEEARERVALMSEGEGAPISEAEVARVLAGDPRYQRWLATELKCATGIVERAASRETHSAVGSQRRESARRVREAKERGADLSDDAYIDSLEPEQRVGYFYRKWVKDGRHENSPWKRYWTLAKEQAKLSRTGGMRTRSVRVKTAPAPRMAAKTAGAPKQNPARPHSDRVQTIIVPKTLAACACTARAIAQRHYAGSLAVEETGTSFRFRQRDPNDFVPGTLRTYHFDDGAAVVVGQPRVSR